MLLLLLAALTQQIVDWPAYGNDAGGMRYSILTQITKENVAQLKPAWTYHHGDIAAEPNQPHSSFECTPLEVNNTVYFSTPFSRVIALDAKTGDRKWAFDPKVPTKRPLAGEPLVHRGVAYWEEPDTGERRIFVGTYNGSLYSLDANTGLPDPKFGENGSIDLKKGLRKVGFNTYQIAQPPTVIGSTVVMGSTIGDNNEADAGDGSIRAFNVRTGKQLWSFDPAPKGSGAANAWAVISADPATNTVFVPTSSPSPDFYGGLRKEEGHANSLVALDAADGHVKWSYQVVHHDVWDYDIPAQPILCEVKNRPAVVIMTKMGFVFVLDRETGKPLLPVEERPIALSTISGEKLSKTEPFPVLPRPLVPTTLEPWGRNAQQKDAAKARIADAKGGSIYMPPGLRETIQIPGRLGGCNWSGGAFDPESQTLYTNTNNLAMSEQLIPRAKLDAYMKAHPGQDISLMQGAPYAVAKYALFTPEHLPITKPPWGSLHAVDLSTGKERWSVPLGVMPQVKNVPGADQWGAINLGGAIVTKSGLIFIAGTCDDTFRAFDAATGKCIWSYALPASGNATPMTYQIGGKQYIVLCAGGHSGMPGKIGDAVIAFALP